jgi:hypothetical protein
VRALRMGAEAKCIESLAAAPVRARTNKARAQVSEHTQGERARAHTSSAFRKRDGQWASARRLRSEIGLPRRSGSAPRRASARHCRDLAVLSVEKDDDLCEGTFVSQWR